MAGFEVVVRPVVFPNIRPAPARSLPPQDDPEKGFAVIKGNGAKSMTTSNSFSMSMSKSRSTETERRVDEARVYQEEDDGTVNQGNFVDMEVATRIKMQGGNRPAVWDPGSLTPRKPDNIQPGTEQYNYRAPDPKQNVEIKKKDIIKTPFVPDSAL